MAVKGTKKKMLSDRIVAKLNKPKSKDYDIEDEDFNYGNKNIDDDSNAEDHDDEDDEREREEVAKREHYVKVAKSKLRDNSLNLGDKYTGSKVTRGDLFDDEAEESDEDSDSEKSEEESENDILADVTDSENEGSEMEDESVESEGPSDNNNISEESENEGDESNEDEDEIYKRSKIAKLLDTEKQQIFNRLSTSAKSDTLKGYTILRQGSEYDKILDSRIKLQKAVISANSLPINHKSFEENKTKQSNVLMETTEKKLYNLIEKLIRLRANQLYKDKLVKNQIDVNLKKRKLADYLEANASIDNACSSVRKSVLMKWSNRVQSASGVGALNQGKFKVINQSVWTQVNNQLGDMERLIKKTKINRRGVTPIGYIEEEADKAEEVDDYSDNDDEVKTAGLSNIDKSLQTNDYIFDDDDFYRLLLNDMINKKLDRKQANNSAILMLSKTKMQKNYERMATKGRKLKYTVQEPLVQYEIPRRKYYSWGDDQIDELFAGLFGMNFNIDDSDENSSGEEAVGDEQNDDITALKESGVKLFG